MGLRLALFACILAYCGHTGTAEHGPYKVLCTEVNIETLIDPFPHLFRKAKVCYPDTVDGSTFPLHSFAHGDGGGGASFWPGYHGLMEQLASFGFVVPAYLSCWIDTLCDNGESSFLEVLKTIEYLEQNPTTVPIDFSKPYTVSGHSTGARVALMLAAIKDTPRYLKGTRFANLVTDSMRSILNRTVAFTGDHTDPMSDTRQNPDVSNYDISKSAVFLITGTKDQVEPKDSSWKDFVQLSTSDKIHVNFNGDSHLTPHLGHHEGSLIAYFSQYHALGDLKARDKIYGNNEDSLQNSDLLAPAGATNNGAADIPFLACSSAGLTVPQKLAKYCSFKDVVTLVWM